ncbi:MAG: hypothetical protein JKY53_14535 [Flavobacteriales bacterium]|nr:hypothetical protein [Flavobacteriales bacterium]
MESSIKLSLIILCFSLFLFSCSKEKIRTPSTKKNAPTTEQDETIQIPSKGLNDLFSRNLLDKIQLFTIDPNQNDYFITEKGTHISLTNTTFTDLSGNVITEPFTLEYIEIFDRASMISTNMGTIAMKNNTLVPLVSGGEFHIQIPDNITFEGSIQIRLPIENTTESDNYNSEMKKFKGGEFNSETIVWKELDTDTVIIFMPWFGWCVESNVTRFYSLGIFPSDIGWTNCDVFYDDPRPKINILIEVPEGFDSDNTRLFILFDGEDNIAFPLTYYYDGVFTDFDGVLPIGADVSIIALTEIEEQLHYAIIDTQILENHQENISSFTQITPDELQAIISSLP